MNKVIRHWLITGTALLISACAMGPSVPAGVDCVAKAMVVTDQFHGARRGTCKVLSSRHVRLDILPEDDPPINDSPWFAFRIESPAPTSTNPGTAKITLRYAGGHHRYWPKLSYDGMEWQALAESDVTASANGRTAKFQVALDGRPLYVSAQELISPVIYDRWNRKIESHTDALLFELGKSRKGQPIFGLDTSNDVRDVLFITGRQHPPEVSGAFAFFAFTERLLANTDLAREFRKRFRIIAIPLLNPDGVNAGNWRHGLGGVDLNRDWGPFTQPETQLIRDLLAEIDTQGHKIRVFLDFHSTNRNVFYTQNEDFVTEPPGFMKQWLESAAPRITNYEFSNSENAVSEQANSKNYMYKRYGIPTATYEVGDETDRGATQDAARVFAEELMTLMLAQEY